MAAHVMRVVVNFAFMGNLIVPHCDSVRSARLRKLAPFESPLNSQHWELRDESEQVGFGLPSLMIRRVALAVSVCLVIVALFIARGEILRRRQLVTQATQAISQPSSTSLTVAQAPADGGTPQPSEQPDAASEADSPSAAAETGSPWKSYTSSEYGFEISYPADWRFFANYVNNYGKPPLAPPGSPEYAGETRTLFAMEMEGPSQSREGGGDFSDGAIIDVQITGTSGNVESWTFPQGRWSLKTSTPADWVKQHSSLRAGDQSEIVAIDTNGFQGGIHLVCAGTNPCDPSGEEGGAYRTLPSGRVLLIGWNRMVGENDFSYQKYLLPMLSSFRLLN